MIKFDVNTEGAFKFQGKIHEIRNITVEELQKIRKIEEQYKEDPYKILDEISKICVFQEKKLLIFGKKVFSWKKYGMKVKKLNINAIIPALELITKNAMGEAFFQANTRKVKKKTELTR